MSELRDVPGPSALGGGWRRTLELLAADRGRRLQARLPRHRARVAVVDLPAAAAVRRPAGRVHAGVPARRRRPALPRAAAAQHGHVRLLPGGDARRRWRRSSPRSPCCARRSSRALVIPLAVVLTSIFNLGLNLLVVVVFLLVSGVGPHWTWLLFPVLFLGLAIFTTAVSMLVSALYPRYRDVGIIWSVASTALLYATPVLYPARVRLRAAARRADRSTRWRRSSRCCTSGSSTRPRRPRPCSPTAACGCSSPRRSTSRSASSRWSCSAARRRASPRRCSPAASRPRSSPAASRPASGSPSRAGRGRPTSRTPRARHGRDRRALHAARPTPPNKTPSRTKPTRPSSASVCRGSECASCAASWNGRSRRQRTAQPPAPTPRTGSAPERPRRDAPVLVAVGLQGDEAARASGSSLPEDSVLPNTSATPKPTPTTITASTPAWAGSRSSPVAARRTARGRAGRAAALRTMHRRQQSRRSRADARTARRDGHRADDRRARRRAAAPAAAPARPGRQARRRGEQRAARDGQRRGRGPRHAAPRARAAASGAARDSTSPVAATQPHPVPVGQRLLEPPLRADGLREVEQAGQQPLREAVADHDQPPRAAAPARPRGRPSRSAAAVSAPEVQEARSARRPRRSGRSGAHVTDSSVQPRSPASPPSASHAARPRGHVPTRQPTATSSHATRPAHARGSSR